MSSNKILIVGGTDYEIHLIAEKLLSGGKERDFIIEVIPEETLPREEHSRIKFHRGFIENKTILEDAIKEGIKCLILNLNPWLLSAGDPGYKLELDIGREIIEFATKYKVEQFIYISFLRNFLETPFFASKNKLEEHLLSKEIPLITVLKPAFYMENLSRLKEICFHANTFCQPLKASEKLPLISFEDVSKVVCIVATNGKQFHKTKIDLAAEYSPVEELARNVGFDFKEIAIEDIPLQYREIYNCFRYQQGRENIQFNDLKNLVHQVISFGNFLEKRRLLPVKDTNQANVVQKEKVEVVNAK